MLRTNAQFGATNCATSLSEYALSIAQRRTVCRIGAHDPRTPLTSIGSILIYPKLRLAHNKIHLYLLFKHGEVNQELWAINGSLKTEMILATKQ